MVIDTSGLSDVSQVEALADQLSACADALHARILQDIKGHQTGQSDDDALATARAMLDDEAVLRQRANGLYADAARAVVATLGASQQKLIGLTATAASQIRHIAMLGDAVGLVAGLLMLAGAAATGQPAPVVLALEKIAHQLQSLKTDGAAPAPAP